MLLDAPPETTPAPDPDALIEEARLRQRRRRRGVAAAVVILVAISVAAFEVLGRSSSPAGVVSFADGPVVNVPVFAGHGRLAFASDGAVYVVSKAGARKISLPGGSFPVDPVLSPNGKRLAFLVTMMNGTGARLWLANGDGTSAHESVEAGGIVGWKGQELVVWGRGLELLGQGGDVRTIVRSPGAVTGAALSPDGKTIAYTTADMSGASRLETVSVAGGPPTMWPTLFAGAGMVAGWWTSGIGVYSELNGYSPELQPLDVFARRGARPAHLFADAAINAYAASETAVLPAATPGSRKRTFETVVTPGWSPDGKTMVYADPLFARDETSKKRVLAWYANHPAHLYDALSGKTRALPAANGGTMFAVAPHGQGVVFERENAIWLLPRLDAKAVKIAQWVYPHGLPPHFWPGAGFSGELSWAD